MLRKALLELELPSEKRITLEAWRDFSVKFQNLVHQAGVGEEEGYQRLLEKVGGLRKHVIEKELEEEKKTPQVEIIFPMVLEEEDVVDFLNGEVGDVPKSLLKLTPTTYRVTFDAKKTAEKAVGLNERRLEGTAQKIRATILQSRANLLDAINFITENLEAEERKAMKMGNPTKKKITNTVVGRGLWRVNPKIPKQRWLE